MRTSFIVLPSASPRPGLEGVLMRVNSPSQPSGIDDAVVSERGGVDLEPKRDDQAGIAERSPIVRYESYGTFWAR